jgi:Uma2 family endonuclease
MPARALLTYGDYAALPDDGRRYELHWGELSVTRAPGTRHQGAIVNVTVVQPDVLYIASDRLSIISERGIEGAPTLVVEVLSPSTAQLDRVEKMKLYAEHGVPYYWIVDPEQRSIEAYTLTGSAFGLAVRATNEPTALPPFSDLTIDPATIWS